MTASLTSTTARCRCWRGYGFTATLFVTTGWTSGRRCVPRRAPSARMLTGAQVARSPPPASRSARTASATRSSTSSRPARCARSSPAQAARSKTCSARRARPGLPVRVLANGGARRRAPSLATVRLRGRQPARQRLRRPVRAAQAHDQPVHPAAQLRPGRGRAAAARRRSPRYGSRPGYGSYASGTPEPRLHDRHCPGLCYRRASAVTNLRPVRALRRIGVRQVTPRRCCATATR